VESALEWDKRLIIFDVEGTLIDCVPQSLICWREAFASCGFEISRAELHHHSGRDPAEMIRLLLPEPAADRWGAREFTAQGGVIVMNDESRRG
jgi:beta-phosphoglucomutase-like phosphatase (HAD superfamily)